MISGSLGRRTSDGTTGTAAYELIAPLTKGCYLKEMVICLASATASTFGLGRPAAAGITPTAPVTVIGEYPTANRTKPALAWATGPTIPAQFFRRLTFPATIASTRTWIFERGLFIPAGASLVLWNLAANGLVDVSVVVEEMPA